MCYPIERLDMKNHELTPAYMYVQFRDGKSIPAKDVTVTLDGRIKVRSLGTGKDFGNMQDLAPDALSSHERYVIEKLYLALADAFLGGPPCRSKEPAITASVRMNVEAPSFDPLD